MFSHIMIGSNDIARSKKFSVKLGADPRPITDWQTLAPAKSDV